jgi:excisionase family DNA binding protein
MIPVSIPSPLALRPREAAKALGISARRLWQLTRAGHVPCVRVGSGTRKTVLYPVCELQAWLARETVGAERSACWMNCCLKLAFKMMVRWLVFCVIRRFVLAKSERG